MSVAVLSKWLANLAWCASKGADITDFQTICASQIMADVRSGRNVALATSKNH